MARLSEVGTITDSYMALEAARDKLTIWPVTIG